MGGINSNFNDYIIRQGQQAAQFSIIENHTSETKPVSSPIQIDNTTTATPTHELSAPLDGNNQLVNAGNAINEALNTKVQKIEQLKTEIKKIDHNIRLFSEQISAQETPEIELIEKLAFYNDLKFEKERQIAHLIGGEGYYPGLNEGKKKEDQDQGPDFLDSQLGVGIDSEIEPLTGMFDSWSKIRELDTKIKNIESEIEHLNNQPNKDNSRIRALEKLRDSLIIQKKQTQQKSALGGDSTIVQDSVKDTMATSNPISDLLPSSSGEVFGFGIFQSLAVWGNMKKFKAINKEIADVESRIAKCVNQPKLKQILELRLSNLKHQRDENSVVTFRTTVVIVFQALASFIPAKFTLLAGATHSIGYGFAITVGGVLGIPFALTIGVAYLSWKHREDIANTFQNLWIDVKQRFITYKSGHADEINELQKLEKEKSKHEEVLGEAQQPNNTLEAREARLEKINSLLGKLEKERARNEDRDGSLHDIYMRTLQAKLKEETKLRELEQAHAYLKDPSQIQRIIELKQKLSTVYPQLVALENERQEINDKYRYGKHLANFNGASTTNLQDLDKTLEKGKSPLNSEFAPGEKEAILAYLKEQNGGNEIDPFMEADPFEAVMRIVKNPVKISEKSEEVNAAVPATT